MKEEKIKISKNKVVLHIVVVKVIICGHNVTRGIQHGTTKDVTVWVFGYAPNRVPDLKKFRENWIKDFNDMKNTFIDFAKNIAGGGETIPILKKGIFL